GTNYTLLTKGRDDSVPAGEHGAWAEALAGRNERGVGDGRSPWRPGRAGRTWAAPRERILRSGAASQGATPVPPVVMRGGDSLVYSRATPRSIPDCRARADPSTALMSAAIALCPLTRRNRLSARNRPATHHRRRISPP